MPSHSKADLADAVYRRHGGLTRSDAGRLVDVILGTIRASLAGGRPVRISGFGSFSIVARASRVGRNPRTGERVAIAAARRPVFRPSRIVLHELNVRHRGQG